MCIYIYPEELAHYPPLPKPELAHYPCAFGAAYVGVWSPLFVSDVTSASSGMMCVSVAVFLKMRVGCLKNGPFLTGRVDMAPRS